MPGRQRETERTCIVTRQSLAADALIRFVVAPDGSVVPDFRRRLPGRGIWVTADARHVELAEKRKLFARAHGGPVNVEPGLAGRVEKGLAAAALAALSMARKAGGVVSGFVKVESALAKGGVIGIIHAVEAAPDGIAKIEGRLGGKKLPVIRAFTSEQLDLAFGRPNVIHAALLAGPASVNLLRRVEAWLTFRGEAGSGDGSGRPHDELHDLTKIVSSGPRNE